MKIGCYLSCLLLFAAVSASCQSYRDGQTRTVGQLTDDSVIQLKVKTRLVNDRTVKGLRLNVEAKRGVVNWLGRVATADIRQRALDIAGSVKGVASVEDKPEVQQR